MSNNESGTSSSEYEDEEDNESGSSSSEYEDEEAVMNMDPAVEQQMLQAVSEQ